MKKISSISASCLISVVLTNVAQADHVRKDYNHNINFTYIRTFSFGEVMMTDPSLDSTIKKVLSERLSAKGLSFVSADSEVTIFVHDSIPSEKDLESTYSDIGAWGSGWSWSGWKMGAGGGFRQGLFSTHEPRFGRVIVDVFSTHSHNLLWRGTARIDRSQSKSKQENHLGHDLTKMLTQFPPKTK